MNALRECIGDAQTATIRQLTNWLHFGANFDTTAYAISQDIYNDGVCIVAGETMLVPDAYAGPLSPCIFTPNRHHRWKQMAALVVAVVVLA